MKSLRILVLMLAVGGFPAFVVQGLGQQEVDPDHFDQSSAATINAHTTKAQKNDMSMRGDHQRRKHARASKYSTAVQASIRHTSSAKNQVAAQ